MLTWVHFGDLHASDEDGWQSLADLNAMIAEANRHLSDRVDFAYLPGDVANHAEPEQYRRTRQALDRLSLRWFAIPGDHDFEPGSLDNFYDGLGAGALPASLLVNGHRCLFLDIVSAGRGGPDFRLGDGQMAWLRDQLARSRGDTGRPAVFMHAFPGDLAMEAGPVGALFAQAGVACVDTGHTHYNELLNDGAVIYTATRSTGQIEEGAAGFSLHAVDGSVASWRFKDQGAAWPFVLITSPADHRLVTDPTQPDQAPAGAFEVRAKVFGEGVSDVSLQVDDGVPIAMIEDAAKTGCWTGHAAGLDDGLHAIGVQAFATTGASDRDVLSVLVANGSVPVQPKAKAQLGHDIHSIGAWPAHGLLGSQLGPNKNGKAW